MLPQKWKADWQPAVRRCANSQFITGDIIPTYPGEAFIVEIGKIVDPHGMVVGWTFKTNTNMVYAQLNRASTAVVRNRLRVSLGARDRLSGLFLVTPKQLQGVGAKRCSNQDLVNAKYVPWKSQELPL